MKTSNRSKTALAIAAGILLLNAPSSRADLIDGLVEYWELNGDYSAGVTAEHAGTLQAKGTGLAESGFAPGKFGQAIDLESGDTNNQASVVIGGDENDFDFTAASMSLSIWYTTESLYRDWQTLAGKGENRSWRLARAGTTPSSIKLSLWLTGDGELDQQDGSWHHAVATVDESGHNIYVDGNLVASNTTPGNIGDNGLAMQIGGNPQAANRGWDGMIDDVGIWDRALTADEVAAIWNGGAGASIASLIGLGTAPFKLSITANGSDLDFEWESQAGMLYNLKSTGDLAADFATWDLVEGDLPATPPSNMMSITRPGDVTRFYRVEEFPAPPMTIFSENFDGADPGWATGFDALDTEMNTVWQLGNPAGGALTGPPAAQSGANCYGTNLASNYGISSNTWLRTPAIDLSTATAASVVFQHWVDMDEFDNLDRGTVRVLQAAGLPGTVTELGVVQADITGLSAVPGVWVEFTGELPAAALGQSIVLEFVFASDGDDIFDASGWYLDDVMVTTPAP